MRCVLNIRLRIVEGPGVGREHEFHEDQPIKVGRSQKEVHFWLPGNDQFTSRVHFVILVDSPRCRVLDLGSMNGIRLNGLKRFASELKNGDTIQAGSSVISVTFAETPVPTGSTVITPAAASLVASPLRYSQKFDENHFPRSLPGYQFEQRLQVSAGLNHGKQATTCVMKAWSEALQQRVAVKMIRFSPTIKPDDAHTQRFLREARILKSLNNRYIVKFLDVDVYGDAESDISGRGAYIVMDYMEQGDLRNFVDICATPLSIQNAVGWMCQVLEGLASAHKQKIVHRDIKPANIFLGSRKERRIAQLGDFGLARQYVSDVISGITRTGEYGGTIHYLAPETHGNFRGAQPSADVYSSGATLYYLLTKRKTHLFKDNLRLDLPIAAESDAIPIRDVRSDIPDALARIIHKALSRDLSVRYKDASAMRRELCGWLKTYRASSTFNSSNTQEYLLDQGEDMATS